MFERLAEITATGEKYNLGHEGSDEPLIFTWFPMKSDYEFIPAGVILNESVEQKVERVTKLAKSARSEMVQLTGTSDLDIEERVLHYFELRESLQEYSAILRDCEGVEEGKDKVSVGKNILKEVRETFEAIQLEEATGQMIVENQFNTGLTKNLVPWIDRLETESFKTLEKPENFAHAQEIERDSVVFAKDVRKANKLLGNLTGMVDNLPSKKMFSNQLIDDQKLRFKKIATVAATRVETTRELLVNWNFYVDIKGEAERLAETVRATFSLEPIPEEFILDENDFVHGLPKVLLGCLHLAEQVVASPPRPSDLAHSIELAKLFNQFAAVVELASKLLERVEECTEKTPSQQEVWEQRARLKKVQGRARDMAGRQDKLGGHWQTMDLSSQTDNLDFQPLVTFLHFYGDCYA